MQSESEDLDFRFVQELVTITDDKGVKQHFVIRELSGIGRDTYFKDMGERIGVDINDPKKTVVKRTDAIQAILVQQCLFRVTKMEDGKPVEVEQVPLEFVQAMPVRGIAILHARCHRLSGLGAKDVEEIKNDSAANNSSGSSSPQDSESPSGGASNT